MPTEHTIFSKSVWYEVEATRLYMQRRGGRQVRLKPTQSLPHLVQAMLFGGPAGNVQLTCMAPVAVAGAVAGWSAAGAAVDVIQLVCSLTSQSLAHAPSRQAAAIDTTMLTPWHF